MSMSLVDVTFFKMGVILAVQSPTPSNLKGKDWTNNIINTRTFESLQFGSKVVIMDYELL